MLESPTGTGKSLALLVSTIAWQQSEIEKQLRQSVNLLKDAVQPAHEFVASDYFKGSTLDAKDTPPDSKPQSPIDLELDSAIPQLLSKKPKIFFAR